MAECSVELSGQLSLSQGKGRVVSDCMASPAVQDVAKETNFSPSASKKLNQELHDWEKGKDWKRSR